MSVMKKQQGFTLVELAISLMIIGLLIGAVLKGQELIGNSMSVQVVRQLQGYRTAIAAFRGTYNKLPGDMTTPSTRLPNCTADPCSVAGNGDGLIGTAKRGADAPTLATIIKDEPRVFWVQLAAASLITGVNTTITNGSTFSGKMGNEIPATAIEGMGVGVNSYTNNPYYGGSMIAGNYFVLRGLTDANADNGYPLTARRAKFIDAKMDDGTALSGEVRALGIPTYTYPSWYCINSTDYLYNEANPGRGCNLQVLIEP